MDTFNGFKPTDFADRMEGSTWRKILGRYLEAALSQPGQRFKYWPIYSEMTIHLAYEKDYDKKYSWTRAKLFVHTTKDDLIYGLWLESTDRTERECRSTGDGKVTFKLADFEHWRKFQNRLRSDPELRQALETAMKIPGLTMTDCFEQDSGGALGCRFAFREEHWQVWRPDARMWKETEYDQMVDRIAELPEEKWVDLHIFAQIGRDEALAMKGKIKDPIVTVLRALVPVYQRIVR